MNKVSVIHDVQKSSSEKRSAGFDAPSRIRATQTPEIVIALCGPMGTPLHEVAGAFKTLLEGGDFKYTHVSIIRLSEFIRKECGLTGDASIRELIDAGNELRSKRGHEVLVQLAIQQIFLDRQTIHEEKADSGGMTEDGGPPAVQPARAVRHCHIIDSIKNAAELRLLRQVYGDMLHVVGVYAPIEQRIERLVGRRGAMAAIHELIDRDSGEELSAGQQVRDTFPRADFFLRVDTGTSAQLTARVRRYIELMMGTRIITPTRAERAMYEAYSAARNSACLSRQVGAAIVDADGHLLAVGWNDVPRAFGGLYGGDDLAGDAQTDHRCWNKEGGKCFNDSEKNLLAQQVVDRLSQAGIISAEKKQDAYERIRHDSQLRDLIEFSRAVHAEMHALLSAGRTNGPRIQGGRLFVTTYPCHSCARHLVAAGIAEVYFLEPYRKSLATKLHADAITENETDEKKVRIMPFDGVAPSRFLTLFSSGESPRKDGSGRMVGRAAHPVTSITMEAIETLEGLAIKGLESSSKP